MHATRAFSATRQVTVRGTSRSSHVHTHSLSRGRLRPAYTMYDSTPRATATSAPNVETVAGRPYLPPPNAVTVPLVFGLRARSWSRLFSHRSTLLAGRLSCDASTPSRVTS